MRTSWRLLNKYIKIHKDIKDFADCLTRQGLEVEGIEKIGVSVDQVVVGKILKKDKHPDADKLTVCQVDVGNETLQIVCGAKNHQEGNKVVVSLVGSTLPNGLKIKKAKLRGVESSGMICSKTELGLEKESDGVWILSEDAQIGAPISQYLPEEDTIFHIAITANRSDCLSTLGIAREAGIIEEKNITYPEINLIEDKSLSKPDITITDTENCKRYASRIIKGVKVKESPVWLQEALLKYGARPINNMVDITNFVMFELGQPLHAFDYHKLENQKIIVRKGAKGEKLKALDGKDYELDESMLVIADAKKPVAIAGVMGGANSEVDDNTVDILLESAYFYPGTVRRTSKKLGLKSESSYRFERDIDPENTDRALDMAASLMAELGGTGKISEKTDLYPGNKIEPWIKVRKEFIKQILGFEIPSKTIENLFKLLEFSFKNEGEDYLIQFPPFRRDCSREIDAVEELIRTYGYEKLPETIYPIRFSVENFEAKERTEDKIRNFLVHLSLTEAMNFTFAKRGDLVKINPLEESKIITIKNPLSADYDSLRNSIFYSLMGNLKNNNENGNTDVSLFEIGNIFSQNQDKISEDKKLGIIQSGYIMTPNWAGGKEKVSFYHLKGLLEELFDVLKIKEIRFEKDSVSFLHPGKTASFYLGSKKIGLIGEVHPDMVELYDLKETPVYAELELNEILNERKEIIRFKKISKYQAVEREISFIMSKDSEAGKILGLIQNESPLVISASIKDIYSGKPIPEDKRSISYSFVLQSDERTLTDEEIKKIMDSIIKKSSVQFGASLREG